MNYYFLLEDEKSFLKVLPSWLEHMGFGYERVADIQGVRKYLCTAKWTGGHSINYKSTV